MTWVRRVTRVRGTEASGSDKEIQSGLSWGRLQKGRWEVTLGHERADGMGGVRCTEACWTRVAARAPQ